MASQSAEQITRTERSSSIASSTSTNSSGWLELTTPLTTTNATASTTAAHTFLELTVAPSSAAAPKKRTFSITNSEERANLMMLRARRG